MTRHKVQIPVTKLRKQLPLLIYTLLGLAIMAPLLKPGFILTLDMVFTPQLRMPEQVNNSYLFYAFLHVLNIVIPGDVIQKILLLGIFISAGYGMYRLARFIDGKHIAGQAGWYIAGVFYTINPFTYDRLMAGQYEVLMGYALLPFFVRALLVLVRGPATKPALFAGLWAAGLAIVSIHSIGYIAVLSVIAAGLTLWRERKNAASGRRLLRGCSIAIGIFVVVSCYWLVPLALGKGSTAMQISQFTARDTVAFATAGQNVIEQTAHVIRLQGFWQETRGLYLLPQDNIPAWGMIALMIWIIVGIGLVYAWKSGQRFVAAFFGLTILAGIVLATGVGLQQAAAHVSFLAGFREPQKFAALIALGYAAGIVYGVAAIRQAAYDTGGIWFKRLALVILAVIPLLLTPVLLWGARGQLQARSYPDEWRAANTLLNSDSGQGKTLFLPWHLYMYYGFSERLIASPAPAFFDKPVIVSDNPEFEGAGAANTSPAKQAADRLLRDASRNPSLASDLARQNISHILLAREDDFDDYSYLNQTPDLQRIYHSAVIDVYRNNVYREER